MGNQLLNGIKNMYGNSLACAIKTRIDNGARGGCLTSPWLFNGAMKIENAN